MAGTMMPPAAAPSAASAGRLTVGMGHQQVSASCVNSLRVTTVAERLALHLQTGYQGDLSEFFNLCLALARGIDYAVANNETLPTAHDLPLILRQVCQRRNDLLLQAAIMVLMISVKNACKVGWFKEKETQELFSLADEVGSSFCSPGTITQLMSENFSVVSTVMSRFYPVMKMGQILASLVVKPGYGTHVVDFHISKNTVSSPQDKIRLFVAQAENTETSSCIINPQEVNFLLNGKGVEKRTTVLMDTGPQIPTNVTAMVKYGTNLLQAVGQFNGYYIIVVAFMSVTPLPDTPVLPDYVQPSVAPLDPDSDLIEGPSRISLNCPISYTRMRTPVKGRSCKHHQCFDFSNFVDINTRRPSWRCPHCNQHICYTDICVDQNMVKVLRDVGDNVTDVIISADGSWRAILEGNDHVDCTHEESLASRKEMSEQQGSAACFGVVPMILDLTVDDDGMETVDVVDTEDIKPLQAQIADEFWSSVLNNGPVVSTVGLDVQVGNGNSELTPVNTALTPVITDAISPALNRDLGGYDSHLTSAMQYSNVNEYGRLLQLHRTLNNIQRPPIAVRALPAVSQAPVTQQRSRAILNTAVSNGSVSTTPAAHGLNMSRHHQDLSFIPGQSVQQQVGGLPNSNQLPVTYRPSGLLAQNVHSHQALRMPQPRTWLPSIARSPSPLPQAVPQQGVAQVGVGNGVGGPYSEQARRISSSQKAVWMSRQPPSVPVRVQASWVPSSPMTSDGIRVPAMEPRRNIGGAVQVTSMTDGLVDFPSEQNWRPTGRMRGSLSGRAYSNALRELMIQPAQPAQVPRPPSNVASPFTTPPNLQAMLANSRNA